MQALGCHVFAGGFTSGVMQEMNVVAQLETHNFGRGTVEQRLQVPFINADRWEDWPKYKGIDMLFGNPRCTGFSCLTAGQGGDTHGPWAAQTKDVHDFCQYGLSIDVPVMVWESVQQAYSVGKPLLDYLRDELFIPRGYKILHMFLNAASFGNCQNRRRYFFVAYKSDLKINAEAPTLPQRCTTLRDVIAHLEKRKTRGARIYKEGTEYDGDTYLDLHPDEWKVVPHLAQWECLNRFARNKLDNLRKLVPRYAETQETRMSERPFSLHCVRRIAYDRSCPTLSSSCGRFVHPVLNRPLTIRELATVMGWEHVPAGDLPVHQIAKGVVPAVGTWLARMVKAAFVGTWTDEWETKYDHHSGTWKGEYTCAPERVIDMTHYYPKEKEDDSVQER